MPQVPRYGQRKVGLEALPGVRKTAAETAESKGAGLAMARARTAQTIGAVGGEVANAGINLFAQMEAKKRDIAEKEKHRADQIATLGFAKALGQWEIDTIHNEKTGALTVKGKDAQALPESVLGNFDKFVEGLSATATTPEQKLALERLVIERRQNVDLRVRNHAHSEVTRYEAEEAKGVIETSLDLIGANFFDLRRVGLEIATAEEAVKTLNKGAGEKAIEAAINNLRSQSHTIVLEQMLSKGMDRQAGLYFDEVKDQIDHRVRDELRRSLTAMSTAGEGLRVSEEIWQQHGPKSEADPINLDVMETAARERFKDDPNTLTATIARLRERKAGVDAGRQDRKEAVAGALWRGVAQNKSLAEIQAMPEYQRAPGPLQAQISEHVVQNAWQASERRHTLSQRARAERERADAERERAAMSEMWKVAEPLIVNAMTENQILSLMPNIGVENVKTLLAKKESFKSDVNVRDATIDDNLFKDIANNAGLPVFKDAAKLTVEEKAKLGHMRNMVEQAIASEQGQKKRTLTREEKATVMRNIVDTRVMVDAWTDYPMVASLVWNEKEQAKSYVPIADIKDDELGAWVNLVRQHTPAAQSMSRDQILSRYRSQIQRAHAAALLGLPAEERLRRLKGGQ